MKQLDKGGVDSGSGPEGSRVGAIRDTFRFVFRSLHAVLC